MHVASMLVPQVCPAAGRTMAPLHSGMPLRATTFLRGEEPLQQPAKQSAAGRRSRGATCSWWHTISLVNYAIRLTSVLLVVHGDAHNPPTTINSQRLVSPRPVQQPQPPASPTSIPSPHKRLTISLWAEELQAASLPIASLQTHPHACLSLRCVVYDLCRQSLQVLFVAYIRAC